VSDISYPFSDAGCFNSGIEITSGLDINTVEVFYNKTLDLPKSFPYLSNYITKEEHLRAEKFRSLEDKSTYLFCHASLRLVLSRKLNRESSEIIFIKEPQNKPVLDGNPIFFNISHTNEAFAFAISRNHSVGIDLEKVNKEIDFTSIINNYFSTRERDYVLESKNDILERFFFLWTRKEALLKALGTGITENLSKYDVLNQESFYDKDKSTVQFTESFSNAQFIYSTRLLRHFLSIATSQKAEILLKQIDNDIINFFQKK
jgi:phosphopantetheine--protein transferase-like protein